MIFFPFLSFVINFISFINISKPKYLCPICGELWRKSQNSIQCDSCEKWIHAPHIKNCSNLSYDKFLAFTDTNNKSAWYCPICIFSQLPDQNLDLSVDQVITSDNIKLLPDENFKKFINSCQNIILHDEDEDENEDNIFTHINSMYYGLHDINNLNNDSSSLGILHTNLVSLNKYHDDLEQILSLMKIDFQIIGITEHKIKEVTPISNIKLACYHEFIYTPTQTSHGGSGFYIQVSLAFKKRNDLN